MELRVRSERPSDVAAIREVNVVAFDTPAEADLVDALRANGRARVSLVAELDDRIVGHILFSPMSFEEPCDTVSLGLAPMAVVPDVQRSGFGTRLVLAGLERCSAIGCKAVFVLGHPAYYQRFGFVPASRFGIRSTYNVPDDVFMAMEVVAGSLLEARGVVRYAPEFDGL